MKFEYTSHAEENIKERRLDKKLIENVVRNPDKVIIGKFGRKIAQRIIDNKLLRVVYEEKDDIYIIITAYYTYPERYEV